MLRRVSLLAILLLALFAALALASASVTKRNVKTVTVAAGTAKTISVAYPDALKFGRSHYRGTVVVYGQTGTGKPAKPSKLMILSKGSALGGSVFRARVRNGNLGGTRALRVRVTAITVEPSG